MRKTNIITSFCIAIITATILIKENSRANAGKISQYGATALDYTDQTCSFYKHLTSSGFDPEEAEYNKESCKDTECPVHSSK